MKLTFVPNKISFDEAGCRNEVLGYVRAEMDVFEKEYLDAMGDIIYRFPHTKLYFRQVVRASLEHIREELVDGALTYIAGFNEAAADQYDVVKAYVIAKGMDPIQAGPQGRIVYGNDLDEQHPSRVKYPHPLPTWKHPGIDFVGEANKAVQGNFKNMLFNICAKLPGDIVSKHIHVG